MALYRRYRPQKFQDVIGQEQVTKPLMAALRSGKTAHAYLFSGPRGCGKTTSARILARCLNCVEAPTDTPCGVCESCRELSAEGSGSLDVVEMDAASHGGVDDARDLIERASFAPARDRYKIFIIDEAHMVSNQGFNALLKLVEEPPDHIKFIFATTEPEKVIGTIRSRTHHYPFRLVPPDELEGYLGQICGEEGVDAGAGVLPLVVRAGGGSVRDSLSVLDQLIGGSEANSLTYESVIALLGFTDGSLLDDSIGALAARDGATLFAVVDRVIQSGHDPRRFVEDLLQRLRDIVVISLAGESAHDVLVSVPDDQYERMVQQANNLGAARASHSADLVNDALTQMAGATSPRLQLELLCARLLLPPTAQADSGEPRTASAAGGAGVGGASGDGAQRSKPSRSTERPARPSSATRPAAPAPKQPDNPSVPGRQINAQWAAPVSPASGGETTPDRDLTQTRDEPAAAPEPTSGDVSMIRQRWKEIVADVQATSKSTAALIQTNAQVGGLENGVLTLLFQTQGLATTFNNRGHGPRVQAALHEVLGVNATVEASVGGDGKGPKAQAVPAASPSNQVPDPVPTHGPAPTPDTNGESVLAQDSAPSPDSASGPVKASEAEPEQATEPKPAAEPARGQQRESVPPGRLSSVPDPAPELEQSSAAGSDPAGVLAPLLDGPVLQAVSPNVPSGDEPQLARDEPPLPDEPPLDELYLAEPPMDEPPVAEPPLDQAAAAGPKPVQPAESDEVPFYAQQMPTPRKPEDIGPVSPASPASAPSFSIPQRSRPQPSAEAKGSPSIGDRIRRMHGGSAQSPAEPPPPPEYDEDPYDDGVSPDDPTIAQSNVVGIEVVLSTFKGTVIDEQTRNGE
ncbi:DNA polymerase III subunit gamma and tau [Ancrocorticia populi]|uniref:DNA polymerase III subunit gamma and tau n=1 Tax=Ancrocorticia populi TaxID=2175228 RepID=UPI003F9B4540